MFEKSLIVTVHRVYECTDKDSLFKDLHNDSYIVGVNSCRSTMTSAVRWKLDEV